jgi:hypothetical protein
MIGAVVATALPRGQAPEAARSGGQTSRPSARALAPIDLTGYWVSVVTEDWRWRMITPRKGDYASVPISSEGRRIADSWDPAKDEREGSACKAYGAAGIMRVPGRLHITWENDDVLRIDTDAGTQTRLLRFGDVPAPTGDRGWQGYSRAVWEFAGSAGAGTAVTLNPPPTSGPRTGTSLEGGARARAAAGPGQHYGSLKVVTTNMRAGYLRKNGVPYSDNAVMTEYFDRHSERNGDEWFTVTTTVEDPRYLSTPFITSTGFKRERDGSKWRPAACTAE